MTRLGKRVYQDQLIERLDPRGIPYFWIGGPPPSGLAVEGTDFHAVVNRRIAVTPIHLDLTGRRLLRRLRTWDWTLPDAVGPAEADAATDAAAAAGRRRLTVSTRSTLGEPAAVRVASTAPSTRSGSRRAARWPRQRVRLRVAGCRRRPRREGPLESDGRNPIAPAPSLYRRVTIAWIGAAANHMAQASVGLTSAAGIDSANTIGMTAAR